MKSFYLLLGITTELVLSLTVQQFWIVPDGDQPDFTDTFYVGETVPVQWKALNDSRDDLWITNFDYSIHHYHQIIAKGIDLSVDGSYNWQISIPSSIVAEDAKFVLRFKQYAQPRTAYSTETLELSSPGILILNSPLSSSSASAAVPSSTVSHLHTPAGASHSSVSRPTSEGLSTGAKAGIGAGIGLAALVLIGVVVFLYLRRRRRRRRQQQRRLHGTDPPLATLDRNHAQQAIRRDDGFLDLPYDSTFGSEKPRVENPYSNTAERSSSRARHELPGN